VNDFIGSIDSLLKLSNDQIVKLLIENAYNANYIKDSRKMRNYLDMVISKKTNGQFTLLKYITQRRLEKARNTLLTSKKVKIAMIESGFSDAANFCRKFKEKYHITPSQFMKQYNSKR